MKYDNKTNFYDLRKMCKKVGLKLGEDVYTGRVCNCSSQVNVYYNSDTQKFGLQRHRCMNRFCPVCNHVKSTTLSTFVNSQYENVKDNYHIISLTLTCRNVPLYELKRTQEELYRAFREMKRTYQRHIGKEYAGLRTYEVTYNTESFTFHPHFHTLLLFDKKIPIEKISLFDFGGAFASHLRPELASTTNINISGFGEHIPSINVSDNKWTSSVVWDCELYDPAKSTFFEFTKYMSKFSELVNSLSDEDFRYFYDISRQVKVHSMYGAWRGYLNQMPDEYDEEVYISESDIRQNENCVYIGSVHTPAYVFDYKDFSFCFCKTFDKSMFISSKYDFSPGSILFEQLIEFLNTNLYRREV